MSSLSAVVAATDPSLITVGGLPLHPLAVHVAVVLFPIASVALVALIFTPALRAHYLRPVMAALVAGVGAAVVAVQAGQQLAVITGISEEHRRYGGWLQTNALLLLVVAGWWAWQQGIFTDLQARRVSKRPFAPGMEGAAGLATVALALSAVVLTALVGHSGATAVWGGRINAPLPTAPASAASTEFTAADVQQHASKASCWSSIDGKVYDLTDWIGRHPGGPGVIESICGANGSAAFAGQHSGQSRPADYLAGYQIGTLKGSTGTATVVNALTLAGVQSHNTAANCWTVINGNVYNVTSWISRHPGGANVIQGLCGIDGSAAFSNQHGSQGEPNDALATFLLGPLKH